MSNTEKVLIVAGPTATGKTKLAVHLAQKYNGELINADSRQMYQGFDILSGKDIPPGHHPIQQQTIDIRNLHTSLVTYELNGIPIWLYDVVPPNEEVSVALFRDLATHCIADIQSRGKLPIIVGGTGFYLSAITQPIDSLDVPPDKHIRNALVHASLEFIQIGRAHV